MQKRIKLFGGIMLMAGIPLLCYFLIRIYGGDGRIKLPNYYGGYDSIGTTTIRGKQLPDTFFKKMPELQLTNQLGKSFYLNKDLPHRMVILNFFFTSCEAVCPKITDNFKLIQQAYTKKQTDTLLKYISISVDPKNDTVPQLRKYADAKQADHDKWWFCNAKEKDLKSYIPHLQLPDVKETDSLIAHTNHLILLDSNRYIRGYYNAFDSLELRRLADDISLLILEKKRHK